MLHMKLIRSLNTKKWFDSFVLMFNAECLMQYY